MKVLSAFSFSAGNTFSWYFYSNGASYWKSDFSASIMLCDGINYWLGLWLNQDPIRIYQVIIGGSLTRRPKRSLYFSWSRYLDKYMGT